jgi:D-alanyl-D-alanine carboxypeptidase
MKHTFMKRAGVVTVAVAVVLSTVGSAAGASVGPAPHQTDLQSAVNDWHTLGAVGVQGEVSVGHREGKARSGVAELNTNAPMPLDGHFRIGSNTKTFIAVVVLQLVGEGKLALDDTVDRWLPGVVAGNGNDGRHITVRQLLQHTSGIPNYTNSLPVLATAEGFEQHKLDHYSEAELVALAMQQPAEFAPGTQWNYSNTNYILAGMIIERVTGHSWASEVRSRIVRPLGRRDTSYPSDHPTVPRPAARSYQQFAPDGPLVDVSTFNATAADSAGGMVSTTDDLVTFWRAVQQGRLLKPAQYAAMHHTVLADTFQDILPGMRYGLGIFWAPDSCGGFWAHPGDVPGTSTFNGVSGDRVMVLYRTTGLAGPVPFDQRAFELADKVFCG